LRFENYREKLPTLICLKEATAKLSETIEYLNEITIQQKKQIFKKQISLKDEIENKMALRLAIKESEISIIDTIFLTI
jgi:hypothetical protein